MEDSNKAYEDWVDDKAFEYDFQLRQAHEAISLVSDNCDKAVELAFIAGRESIDLSSYIKKPTALEFTRTCMKENVDAITIGLIYNLFFSGDGGEG